MTQRFQPLDDRIVIKPSDPEKVRPSGLVLPEQAREKPQQGEVLAVGPGRHEEGILIPVGVEVGDTVIYSKYGSTEIEVDGEELLVISIKDVLGRLS